MLVLLFTAGCASRDVVERPDGGWEYRSRRVGAKEAVRRVEVRRPDGTVLVLDGFQSDTVEAVGVAVDAGVRAAVTSLVPGAGLGGLSGAARGAPAGQKWTLGPGGIPVLVPKDDPSEPVPEVP